MASAIGEPVFSKGESKALNSIGLTTITPAWSYGGSSLIHVVQADAGHELVVHGQPGVIRAAAESLDRAGGGGTTSTGAWSRSKRPPWSGNTPGWSTGGP